MISRLRSLILYWVLPWTIVIHPTFGATIHVSKEGDGTDPMTWEGAFSTVGAAIDAAISGDDIWVASWRYNESLVMKDEVSMYGGFAGTEATDEFHLRDFVANETILDATGLNDRVVVGSDQTTLNGLTITNGQRDFNLVDDGGSGMSCRKITMTIRNCCFHHNGHRGGPGIPDGASGGAIFCIDSNLTIENCLFLDNLAHNGGAVFSAFEIIGCNNLLSNCLFDRNSGPAYRGGGISMFENCTFGLFNGSTSSESNDIFASGVTIVNSIIRGGSVGVASAVSFSNVPERSGEEGNIDTDPLFVDPENGDYRLLPNSPCIDAGTKVEVFTDLDGNPRPIDVVGRGHEGETAYDMGCYEFVLKRADMNSDGFVNGVDLVLFQDQWHEDEGGE